MKEGVSHRGGRRAADEIYSRTKLRDGIKGSSELRG